MTKDLEKANEQRKKYIEKRLFNDTEEDLKKLYKIVKSKSKKLVLTQGVYDLIHEGHARYLEFAKSHGDILVVGVDSDRLTKKRKGPSRPIVPQLERIEMLLHLRHVDYVVLKDNLEDNGFLIRHLRPDTLITSSSTKDMTSFGKKWAPYCGEINILPPQSTTSTTARIRTLTIDGASSLAEEINEITTEYLNKLRNYS